MILYCPAPLNPALIGFFSVVEPETARILDRALNGVDIEVEEAIKLFDAKDLELHALCAARQRAPKTHRRRHGHLRYGAQHKLH